MNKASDSVLGARPGGDDVDEGSSRSAWSFSVALSGNDYKRLPTRHCESDGRHERTRFYVSYHISSLRQL